MHSSTCGKNNTDGWNLDQGLAAQYAAQAGLDPDLAADAGEEVWDVLKSLRDATGETDPKRQAKLVKRTKARLAKANLSRHGELVQHIEAKLLALQGRGGDSELAHLTPGEVIVPPQLQTPEVVQAIQQAAQNAGIDMARYTAGSQASSVNPETGMAEFFVECADEGGCRQDPVGYGGSNIYDYDGTTYVHVKGPGQSGGHDVYSADNWAGRPGGIGTGGDGSFQVADAGGGSFFADVPRTGWPRNTLKCQEAMDKGGDIDLWCGEKFFDGTFPVIPSLKDLQGRPLDELIDERQKIYDREVRIVNGVQFLNDEIGSDFVAPLFQKIQDHYSEVIGVYDQAIGQ